MPRTKENKQKCVEEIRKYQRDWYYRNKKVLLSKAKVRKHRERELIRSFKAGRKCLYCPEHDSRALDWHHREPTQELFMVSAGESFSRARWKAEILKCDLICANCHRKMTISYAVV